MKVFNKNAFTLIEILVVVFILCIIAGIVAQFLITGFKSTKFNEEQEQAIEHARDGVGEMTRMIRAANFSENGDYVLSTINAQEIEFYSDPDFDHKMEKVKYYLDGVQLKRSVMEPGDSNLYTEAPTITTVADYVNNLSAPIFRYYDSNMFETDNINSVRSINVSLKINVTPQRAPDDYILESSVQLRNLKDN
ncbi:MAG TPA: type II secretion system protein [bacterium]|mgnify:CR=1 FL=1|jgi:prepilin-type N-terminal cleavage/methylation domain-containing protein|nr:type II secretion system protein [bacterium]HOG38428.1 type II secretion system protein [bacterium]HQI03311.1 type II secretion system protein [bacterium]